MRAILALVLSFHFINTSNARELGERAAYSPTTHLLQLLSQQEALTFQGIADAEVSKLREQGFASYATQLTHLSAADQESLKGVLAQVAGKELPTITEKTKGHWVVATKHGTLVFTYVDLFKRQVQLNGEVLSLKDLSVAQIQALVTEKLKTKKVSWLDVVGAQLAIPMAHAEPVSGTIAVIIMAVVGGILAGTAWYQWSYKPEKAVKNMNEVSKKLDADAEACESAKVDAASYDRTFDVASEVSERSRLNSMTSTERALQFVIKEQITSGERKATDCYNAIHEAGKKMGLDVPLVTENQLARRELMSGAKMNQATDTKSALFGICDSYNRLAACMEQFVQSHVNDGEIGNFKDDAVRSHRTYQRRSEAQGQ